MDKQLFKVMQRSVVDRFKESDMGAADELAVVRKSFKKYAAEWKLETDEDFERNYVRLVNNIYCDLFHAFDEEVDDEDFYRGTNEYAIL